ncbi:MAG: glutaredoxin [Anaerocolumna sp.]|jgi:glutaredoxin|nr:glutaredoxin [Anaerocolumna sp.]
MKSVIIYTNTGCDSCHEAKAFLDENNVPYIEHDISKDKEAKKDIMKRGYMSVPLIMIDDKVLKGFDKKEISIELEL